MKDNKIKKERWKGVSRARLIDKIDALEKQLLDQNGSPDRQSPAGEQDSARHYDLFSRFSSDWLWEMDEDLRFTYIAPRGVEAAGVRNNAHIGKTHAEFAGEDADTPEWREHLADLDAHRPFRNFNFVRKAEDGRKRYLSTSGNPVHDDGGNFKGYVGTGSDITEQELVRANFAASEDRLQNAIEALDDGFVLFDREERLILANQIYKGLYGDNTDVVTPGTKFEDILRKAVERGQIPDAVENPDSWIQLRLEEFRKASGKYETRTQDGRWVRASDRRTANGEIVGIRFDITGIKAAQDELENARQAAELANLAKTNFLATMSHEIRTPLNGVLGLAQLLAKTPLTKEQDTLVDTILSSGQALLAIINDVLDMSKIEAGGLDLEETVFSVPQLITGVGTLFQNVATDKALDLSLSCELPDTPVLKGDPVRLRQIISNLMSNAIKFTDRGSVTVVVSQAVAPDNMPAFTPEHTVIRVRVSDSGLGISEDRLPVIFDAFTQEDSTITRKFGGTGLGLSIVKQLADLMGGVIEVESEVEKGTRFDVYLPFLKASEPEVRRIMADQDVSNENSAPRLNILVAEDNEVNAMITKAFLEKAGHKVRVVGNGRLAVNAVKKSEPDLILMDVHMPEVDGLIATKILRSMDKHAAIPIVGVTAEAFTERHAGFISAGMDYVLTKPFSEEQLNAVLFRFGKIDGVSARRDAHAEPEEEPEEGAPPIGDEDRLARMISVLGVERVCPLLASAPDGLGSRQEELSEALDNGDADGIHEAAHAIKGTAGSLYAPRLSWMAQRIEAALPDLDAVRALMEEFETTADLTVKWWLSAGETETAENESRPA